MHRKMTSVGLIDVGSPDLREVLMKTISSKDLKVVCQGKNLKVARAKTKSASERDSALVKAAELLKKQPGAKDVSIEWSGNRGVKVASIDWFSQGLGNDVGTFVGSFAHLKLP